MFHLGIPVELRSYGHGSDCEIVDPVSFLYITMPRSLMCHLDFQISHSPWIQQHSDPFKVYLG